MIAFDAAQPALLYLVPFCVAASFFVAAKLGSLNELWEYTEEGMNDENDAAKKDD